MKEPINPKWTVEQLEAQAFTLRYLLEIAQQTKGAGVWESLFCEVHQTVQRDITDLKAVKP